MAKTHSLQNYSLINPLGFYNFLSYVINSNPFDFYSIQDFSAYLHSSLAILVVIDYLIDLLLIDIFMIHIGYLSYC